MGGPAITVGAVLACPHGGRVAIVAGDARVRAGGAPVATVTDDFPVAGCPNRPLPCVGIEWTASAARVRIGGRPPVVQGDIGRARSAQGPAGAAIVIASQMRVLMR